MLFNKNKNFLNQQAILDSVEGKWWLSSTESQIIFIYKAFHKKHRKKREKRKHNLYLVFAIAAATMPFSLLPFFSRELIYTLCWC